MLIKRIPAGIYAANCYIVMDENTKDTIVIDIGGDADDIIKELRNLKANLKAILLTHGHVDHVSGVLELKREYDVPVYLSSKDEELMIKNTYIYGNFGDKRADYSLNQGDKLKIGSLNIQVIATPGHTPGGVCFLIENDLFTGDTLFYGSVGRSDLEGGDHIELINNIKSKLVILSDDIKVYCGHGPSTTIGKEKQINPFLR